SIDAVAHQAAGHSILAKVVYRRHRMACRQGQAVHREADRAGGDLRRSSRDRDRERAAIRRGAGAHARACPFSRGVAGTGRGHAGQSPPPSLALWTVWAVLGGSVFGRLLSDDTRRQVAALTFLVQATGPTFLTLASSPPALVSGCVLFGLGVGNLVSLPPLIMQKEFAAGDVSKAVALTVAINQAVFAFAPAVLGTVHDIASGYVWSFGLAATIQFAS